MSILDKGANFHGNISHLDECFTNANT